MTQRSAGPGAASKPSRATRRTLLAAAVGGIAVAAPASWRRPLIDTVVLPAHGQTTSTIPPGVALTSCAPETIPDGTSVSFTLSETTCSTGADGVAFLTADCSAGVTTLNIAPGILWSYISSTPASNPINVAAGTPTPVTFVVENLVTGRFYRMEFDVSDDGTDCTLSEIMVFGPFDTAAAV